MQFHQCILPFTILSDNALYKDETARLKKKYMKNKQKKYSYCKHAYCLVSITQISSQNCSLKCSHGLVNQKNKKIPQYTWTHYAKLTWIILRLNPCKPTFSRIKYCCCSCQSFPYLLSFWILILIALGNNWFNSTKSAIWRLTWYKIPQIKYKKTSNISVPRLQMTKAYM